MKKRVEVKDNTNTPLEPQSCFSSFFYTYLNKVVESGSKIPYQFKMMYKPSKLHRHEGEVEKFEAYLNDTISKGGDFSFNMVYYFCRKKLLLGAFYLTIALFMQVLIPIFLKQFIEWLSKENLEENEKNNGYIFMGILAVTLVSKTFIGPRGMMLLARGANHSLNVVLVRKFS